jgi:hypothetical protein
MAAPITVLLTPQSSHFVSFVSSWFIPPSYDEHGTRLGPPERGQGRFYAE